jgi:hypothetical protein
LDNRAVELLKTASLATAQVIRLLLASEKRAGHRPTRLQVKNRLALLRRRRRPWDGAEMLQCILQRHAAGEISYFRAEGRRRVRVGEHAVNALLSPHARQADHDAGVVMEATDGALVRPQCAVSLALLPRLLGCKRSTGEELASMLDACVLDLTHKVNCYRWYVAIVSARDATWTTRIVASAMVPREDCESVSFVLGEFAHAMEALLGHRACPSAVISDKGLLVPGAPARALADGNALAAPSGTLRSRCSRSCARAGTRRGGRWCGSSCTGSCAMRASRQLPSLTRRCWASSPTSGRGAARRARRLH